MTYLNRQRGGDEEEKVDKKERNSDSMRTDKKAEKPFY